MRKCANCSKEIEDDIVECPYCGHKEKPLSNRIWLTPGMVLFKRYCIGSKLNHDKDTITYYAWDYNTDKMVWVVEYYPLDCSIRTSKMRVAFPESKKDRFVQGANAFRDEAVKMMKEGGSVKILDCLIVNGTVYSILEIPKDEEDVEEAQVSTKGIAEEVKKPRKKNHVWPVIVGVIVLILGGVLFVLMKNGMFDSAGNSRNRRNETDTTVAATAAETSAVEMNVNVPVLHIVGHSYACYFGCESWEQARDYCESVGGHLAVISSQRENDALYAFSRWCGYDNTYIGYSDIGHEGSWEWVNGETSDYTNWSPTEPNGFTASENYAVIVDGGTWNDGDFQPRIEDGLVSFICEWDQWVSGESNLNYYDLMRMTESAQDGNGETG